MSSPPPDQEARRLSVLRNYGILDTGPERSFDDLTLLASRICETPMAYVSLIDEKRQWLKSKVGIDTSETPRSTAFCAEAILDPNRILEIPDAELDPRFASNEWVRGKLRVRFYAGAPLVDAGGHALGALCVMDRQPRTLNDHQRAALEVLSRHVVSQMELRIRSRDLTEEAKNRERAEAGLRQQNEKLTRSQAEASRLLDLAERSRGALLSILEDEQRTSRILARTNRSLKMLSRCNEALILATDETALLKEVCQIAVELGGHRMAWVGYAEEDARKRIVPMGQFGDDSGYLEGLEFTWADNELGSGPAGRCIRESRPIVYADITDPKGHFRSVERALDRGYRSVTCVPLRDKARTFGTLCLYSGEIGDLEEAEIRLLQELTDDLAFGIGAIRSRVVRERTEQELVASLREKESLLKEVHHRVKNNLQVIASLLRLEGRRIDHPITRSVLNQMQGRIQSMALLHETLYRSGNFSRVDLPAYLTQLANQLFRSLGPQAGTVKLHLDLTPVRLDIEQAIPCGLIVNELASNSLKHGFPDGRGGDVWIHLRRPEDAETLVLTVSDNGVGLSPDFDLNQKRSLGLQLVFDLARQLQGNLAIGPGPQAVFEVTFTPTHLEATGKFQRPPVN